MGEAPSLFGSSARFWGMSSKDAQVQAAQELQQCLEHLQSEEARIKSEIQALEVEYQQVQGQIQGCESTLANIMNELPGKQQQYKFLQDQQDEMEARYMAMLA